jgi:hypothetical protein
MGKSAAPGANGYYSFGIHGHWARPVDELVEIKVGDRLP